MTKIITTQDLKKKIDEKDNFHLVDVLSPESFEGRHIPGADNVPEGPDFVDNFEKKIGSPKSGDIVLYCASSDCMASVSASRKLEQAGYTDVKHYKDGLAGWQRAGYEFEEPRRTK